MTKITLKDIGALAGFSVENVPAGGMAKVLVKGSFTSDEKEFYTYMKQITNLFLNKAGLFVNQISYFLIILHADHSADIYINDFTVLQKIRIKRSVKAGERVGIDNVADMDEITFPDILITDTDNIIYCFKVGWKFGLYFNFMQVDGKTKLNVAELYKELGKLSAFLHFEEVYKTFETESIFSELIQDGWFPFIQLLGGDYEKILEVYQNKFDFENRIMQVVNKYDKARIESISAKWFSHLTFSSKIKILQAGLGAYYEGTESGYINSIKNLYTEIEGILQIAFSPSSKKSIPELIIDLEKSCIESSLYFPSYFREYLSKFLYKNFNLKNNKVDLSRHTAGHGLAKPEDYSKMRALQGILILDQIFYYISSKQ